MQDQKLILLLSIQNYLIVLESNLRETNLFSCPIYPKINKTRAFALRTQYFC